MEKTNLDPMAKSSLSCNEPDKEKMPVNDTIELKESNSLKGNIQRKPSIILCFDGCEQKVILYQGNEEGIQQKSKHKKKKPKHSRKLDSKK
jgi:hypothetical protein